MQKNKKWLLVFSTSSLIVIMGLATLNIYVDPYSTFSFKWKLPYKSDRNPSVAKLRRLSKKPQTQCLIVGSSRSEFFLPKDLESKLDCSSFSASIPGSLSYEKYAFSRFALDNLSELKEIWYVIDFYEFNQKKIPTKILHVDKLGQYFSEPMFEGLTNSISSLSKYSSLFSMSTLRASFKNLKDYIKEREINHYKDDGTTTRPFTVKLSDSFEKRVDHSIKQYVKGEWLNYKRLSKLSFRMLEHIRTLATKKKIKVHFIVSPLSKRVQDTIEKDINLSGLRSKMSDQLKTLEQKPYIQVWDFLSSQHVVPAASKYWYDGAHMTRAGSLKIIDYIRIQDGLDI